MQRKNILFLGFGDIAERACRQLSAHRLVGVARSPKMAAPNIEFFQAAADSAPVGKRLLEELWDAVVITLTPTEFSDRAYEIAYVQTLDHLLTFLKKNPPKLVLFASSTGVYPQNDGEWVNEDTPVEPVSFSGKRLLEAENLLKESGLNYSILRIAGIYGPKRDVVLRQVKMGQGGSTAYTNRIHADDCASFTAHLLTQFFNGEMLEPVYIVADGSPATGKDVRLWLAEQMGLDKQSLTASVSERGGNKRCANERMLKTGYRLLFADYRAGYQALLADYVSASSGVSQ